MCVLCDIFLRSSILFYFYFSGLFWEVIFFLGGSDNFFSHLFIVFVFVRGIFLGARDCFL